MSREGIERAFPGLANSGYFITSPETVEYNCIAWAAGDTKRWWEPDPFYISYWPPGVTRRYALETYIEAYESLDYVICHDDKYEPDFEKIAIYVDSNGKPTHAAKQLDSGSWTSKLGSLEDIKHTLDGLGGSGYGSIAAVMKRPKRM
ncbi:MAG TPA: hypothetical protein VI489_02815 [Candidatus Brocadiaceae bacterium]